ncbi:MAG: trypsin-like serine protease [Polyangia bacterium]
MNGKVLLPLLLLAGCTLPVAPVGAQQSAIIGGTTDTSDPSVVLVYAQTSSQGGAICSGEVVSPHMVLTAAHCVDPAVLKTTTAMFGIFLGSNINDQTQANDQSNWLEVAGTDFDPQFDVNQLQNGHDIGEVTTTTVIPRDLLPIHQTQLTQSDVGKSLRLVGFGISSGSDSQGTTAGTRRTVGTTVEGVDSKLVYYGDSQHNTCEGDSGGPAFMTINGVETIVGVTSFGDQSCAQGGVDTDVADYYSSFILPHINAAESTTTTTTTPPVPDAGTTGTTTTTTGSDDGGTTSTGTTGAQVGGMCKSNDECASGICTEGGKEQYCTQSCNLDDASTCPSTMKCEIVSGAPYCVLPTKSRGCSAASAGGAPVGVAGSLGSIFLLLGVACFLRYSRRLG